MIFTILKISSNHKINERVTMKNQIISLGTALMIVIGLGHMGTAYALDKDVSSVNAADDRFYAALNTFFTGDVEPMKNVWSHADDVTYMGPGGGFQKGWPSVLDVWEKTAAMKLGGKVTPERLHTTISDNLAIVLTNEIGENLDKDGKPVKVYIRATNLYRNENGQWKMIGHHTDLLPYLSK